MIRFLFALLVLAISGCTLGTAQGVRENSLNGTQTALPFESVTSAPVVSALPTQLPPGQATPVLQSNATSATCGRLRVSVGTDPGNTLRLRQQPNNSSTILVLIPNNTLVRKVAGSQEVSAGGYTWVNIEYTDPNGIVATGWAAKDAMKNQATLVAEGC